VSEHHDYDARPHPEPRETPSEWEILEIAVRELAIAKGLITADDHRRLLEGMDGASPALGAKVVARAWVDEGFKKRLLEDGSVHNLVVCTLCSCYPRPILGLPPDWYKSPSYRSRAVRWPRVVLAEFGTVLAEGVSVHVHDSTADMRYLVMPMRPAGTEGWSEEQLAELVTRDTMIGVTVPRVRAVRA
jgi:nitrile hydratase